MLSLPADDASPPKVDLQTGCLKSRHSSVPEQTTPPRQRERGLTTSWSPPSTGTSPIPGGILSSSRHSSLRGEDSPHRRSKSRRRRSVHFATSARASPSDSPCNSPRNSSTNLSAQAMLSSASPTPPPPLQPPTTTTSGLLRHEAMYNTEEEPTHIYNLGEGRQPSQLMTEGRSSSATSSMSFTTSPPTTCAVTLGTAGSQKYNEKADAFFKALHGPCSSMSSPQAPNTTLASNACMSAKEWDIECGDCDWSPLSESFDSSCSLTDSRYVASARSPHGQPECPSPLRQATLVRQQRIRGSSDSTLEHSVVSSGVDGDYHVFKHQIRTIQRRYRLNELPYFHGWRRRDWVAQQLLRPGVSDGSFLIHFDIVDDQLMLLLSLCTPSYGVGHVPIELIQDQTVLVEDRHFASVKDAITHFRKHRLRTLASERRRVYLKGFLPRSLSTEDSTDLEAEVDFSDVFSPNATPSPPPPPSGVAKQVLPSSRGTQQVQRQLLDSHTAPALTSCSVSTTL
eukprot:m.121448 g.121448  ORF g.121448 m.121448 type:complete len:511 (+) comp15521_c0_seq2:185-1717(+)